MSTTQHNLNLARKWRPKTFDTVVGQDIAIRMLKNSLYLDKFFPVYLFAGQRGCGKTSSARIFAAAINCEHLSAFQKSPASSAIPCLNCSSCVAMINGDHPDFIEIDAASHTGVDNVRQIIESSSYMPLIGRKKIYLIDEAHMLSKAAFNAFLKILEEPPLSVVFILATTETQKIPTTVLSRCFQLIFNPIAAESLKIHLQQICANEQVSIEDAALDILLNETEGSARDAINLLERVRFSSDVITEETILAVLGKISVKELFSLFDLVIDQNASQMLVQLGTIHFEQRSPQLLWDMLIEICRSLMWVKYNVPTPTSGMSKHQEELKALARKCSINRLVAILNFFWAQEELFLKTNKKHLFLEMTLLQLCQQVDINDLDDLIKACSATGALPQTQAPKPLPAASSERTLAPISSNHASGTSTATPNRAANVQTNASAPTVSAADAQSLQPSTTGINPNMSAPLAEPKINSTLASPEWNLFLEGVTKLGDLLLHSILMQATFIKKDEPSKKIVIQLSAESTFFKNKIEESKPLWQPLLGTVFAEYKDFMYISPAPQQPKTFKPQASPIASISAPAGQTPVASRPAVRENDILTIKDPAEWPQTSLILRFFPGKIKKIKNIPNTFLPSLTSS